jgi:hypothetical protein
LYLTTPVLSVQAPLGDKTTGFVGGGFIRRYFNDIFSLQAEVLYSQKGGQGNMTGTVIYTASNNIDYVGDINGLMTVSLDYVEIPVVAIFSFPADEKWTLTGILGAYAAFKVDGNAKVEGTVTFPLESLSQTIYDYSQTVDLGSMIATTDVGGIVGGGVEVAAGNVQLVFDARLEFGFVSVLDSGDKGVYNQIFSVFAGVGIPFGSEIE